jgi:putative phosphoesterase
MGSDKFIILSDIHSNINALMRFLEYVEDIKPSVILNCGDFLQKGPNPKEVFDIVMNDKRFINILGNNDLELFQRNLRRFKMIDIDHQDWVIEQLGTERIEKLKQLPLKRLVTISGKKFLMVHSRLCSTTEMPILFQGKSMEEYILDYEEDCDYVVLGHTHFQSLVSYWKGKPILNPGSLGISKDNTISFIIASITENDIGFEFKKVKYNAELVKEELRKLKVPDYEHIINFFFSP